MVKYKIPNVPETYRYVLTDLLGVDYSDTVVDNRRSPRMENLVNNNGFLESIHGHKPLIHIDNAPIYGVWNCDGNGDEFIVHCGTKIYRVNNTFTTKTLLKSGVNPIKSSGVIFNDNLLIFDGLRALIYHNVNNTWQIDYLDTVGYVPTTSINRNPDGTGSKTYESPNQLTTRRKNSFLGNTTDTVYQLDGATWMNTTIYVRQLQASGWVDVPTTDYSFDSSTGKVTFTSARGGSPVDGRDNIEIEFDSNDGVDGEPLANHINKCTIATLYGYGGNNNRVFVTGNSDYPNFDFWSYTENCLHYPADNYAKIGNASSPITSYLRLGDGTLAIQKPKTDSDCTIYYRTYNSYNGKDIFPLTAGVKNIGCINGRCSCNFLNDPIFLSDTGIYSIISNSKSTTNEKFAEEKSYYIKNKLLNEPNLNTAEAIVNNTRYYLAINGHVYVADKRFLSATQYSDSSYQYEWFYLDDIDVSVWFNYNEKLYWGDNNGDIRTFDNTYVNRLYIDNTYVDVPVHVYWESDYIYFDNYCDAKTVRKVFIHHNPVGASTIKVSYIDNDGPHHISTSYYDGLDTYPKVIQEKEKISKIMCCKFVIENNNDDRCSFNTLLCEYRLAGKYRGE